MDFIKKNPLMTASLALAIALAIFLGLKIKASAAAAAESGDTVEQLKAFFEGELRAPYSASSGNLEQSQKNLVKAKQEVEELRRRLYQNSRVQFNGRVSNTQCKNQLQEGTDQLLNQLGKEMILVEQGARHFSFGDVLGSDKLPSESVEVPVLMKQFEIVREIVDLLDNAQVTRLISLKRERGVGVAKQDEFELMPFSMVVEGDSASIKDLLTRLQKKSRYFFVIRKPTFVSAPPKISTLVKTAMPESPPPESFRVPEDAPVYAEQYQVSFPDLVKADIRFDFIEFKNPVEEN